MKMALGDRRFVSYKNDDDKVISGYFELVEECENYIKIKSGGNIITIPYHRILKIKEQV